MISACPNAGLMLKDIQLLFIDTWNQPKVLFPWQSRYCAADKKLIKLTTCGKDV